MMTLRHLLFLIHCLPGSSNSVYWDAGINRLPCPLSSSWVSLKGTTDRSSQIEKERALHIHFPCIFLTWSWLCVCVCVCVCVLVTQSCLTVIPWTVAHQAPLSREFSRQEYWSGLPFPSLGLVMTGSN